MTRSASRWECEGTRPSGSSGPQRQTPPGRCGFVERKKACSPHFLATHSSKATFCMSVSVVSPRIISCTASCDAGSAPSSLMIEHITLVSGIMEPLVTPPYAANRLVPAKVGCQISHKSGVRLVHKLSDLLLQIREWQGQPKNSFQQTLRDDRTDWPAAPAGWARLALASWLSLEATEDCIGVYD